MAEREREAIPGDYDPKRASFQSCCDAPRGDNRNEAQTTIEFNEWDFGRFVGEFDYT